MVRNPEADALKAFLISANVSHWKTGTDLFNPDFSWQTIAYCSVYRDILAFTGCIFIIPILSFIWLRLSVTPSQSYSFSRQKHVSHLYPSIPYC